MYLIMLQILRLHSDVHNLYYTEEFLFVGHKSKFLVGRKVSVSKKKIVFKYFGLKLAQTENSNISDIRKKDFPGLSSTLYDSNDGWAIFDDLSLVLHKM